MLKLKRKINSSSIVACLLGLFLSGCAPTHGKFVFSDKLVEGISKHEATLLKNGDILITGGYEENPIQKKGNCPALQRTQIYSFTKNKFFFSAVLNQRRLDHTATLLKNGNVLVAGGTNFLCPGKFYGEEIFDSKKNTFVTIESLKEPRYGHTATLLNSGKVLIAGGVVTGRRQPLKRVEIFDPETNKFKFINDMNEGRAFHSATPLQDGKILLAGGYTDRAELFDPITEKFTKIGNMLRSRTGHDAVRLKNGNVLLVGGTSNRANMTMTHKNEPAGVEIFDCKTLKFIDKGNLDPEYDSSRLALVSPGKVLLVADKEPFSLLFDQDKVKFIYGNQLNIPRAGFGLVTLPNQNVMIIGGGKYIRKRFKYASEIELYDLNN